MSRTLVVGLAVALLSSFAMAQEKNQEKKGPAGLPAVSEVVKVVGTEKQKDVEGIYDNLKKELAAVPKEDKAKAKEQREAATKKAKDSLIALGKDDAQKKQLTDLLTPKKGNK